MSLILAKNKNVASLGHLNRLTMKKIFDQANMTIEEEHLLDHSIESWPKKIDITSVEKTALRLIVSTLLNNENGKLEIEKDFVKKFNLDYTKVYSNGIMDL